MFMELLFKICDPSKSFLLGIHAVKSDRYKLDLDNKTQIKDGGSYKLSVGFLLFELILIFNFDKL